LGRLQKSFFPPERISQGKSEATGADRLAWENKSNAIVIIRSFTSLPLLFITDPDTKIRFIGITISQALAAMPDLLLLSGF
jgi:hypothetical protein